MCLLKRPQTEFANSFLEGASASSEFWMSCGVRWHLQGQAGRPHEAWVGTWKYYFHPFPHLFLASPGSVKAICCRAKKQNKKPTTQKTTSNATISRVITTADICGIPLSMNTPLLVMHAFLRSHHSSARVPDPSLVLNRYQMDLSSPPR